MAEQQQPLSPWTLTPQRILILVLGILAILMILGGIFGGVTNYEILHQAAPSDTSSSAAQ